MCAAGCVTYGHAIRLPVPPVADLVLAGAFLLLTVAEALLSPEVTSPTLHILVAGTAMLALAWRRSFPLERLEPSDVAAAMVFLVGPWWVGTMVRQRAQPTEEAVARAERLERERELQAAVAAAEERTRIARELHDIVSHGGCSSSTGTTPRSGSSTGSTAPLVSTTS